MDSAFDSFIGILDPSSLIDILPTIDFGANKERMAVLVNLVTKCSGHDQSEILLMNLFLILSDLAANNEKRSALASVGAIEAAVAAVALHIKSPVIVSPWLRFVLYLSLSNDPEVASRQAAAGVPEQLLAILELYPSNPVVLNDCMLAMGNLASSSPEAMAYFVTTGRAFFIVAAIMDRYSGSPDVLRWACYLVRWLSTSNRDYVPRAAQAGIPLRLVRAIRTFGPLTQPLLNHSLMALGSLCYRCPKCQAESFVSGALEAILTILRVVLPPGDDPVGEDSPESEDFAVALCFAMNNITSGYYDAQEYLLKEGALALLVRVLELFPTAPQVVENALFAISTIACNFYLAQIELNRLNTVSAVLRVGYLNRNSPSIMEAIFLTLGNISGDSIANKLEIAKNGGLHLMLDALEMFPNKKGICSRASRTIEFVFSIDENYKEYASEEVVNAVRAAAERYPDLPELKNCLLSITRSQDPAIVAAVAAGKCSGTVIPQCPGVCPYKTGRFYCPVCAKPQYTYFCVDCSVETGFVLRLCPVCVEHHLKEHPNHELHKTFMSRRCYCTKCLKEDDDDDDKKKK